MRQEAGFVGRGLMPPATGYDPRQADLDRIVVVGGSTRTLDMLRLATIRSDAVVLVAEDADERTRRFMDHFAVDYRQGHISDSDIANAVALVVTIGDVGRENAIVRGARRHGVPVHVESRPLVSDFTMMELLERKPSSLAR